MINTFYSRFYNDNYLAKKYGIYADTDSIRIMPKNPIPCLIIEKVIFNGPATIVFWSDGTKTIVKCTEDDIYDQEKGLAMAICKKVLGDDFKRTFKEYIKEEETDDITISSDSLVNAFQDLNNKIKKLSDSFKF